MEEVKNSTSMSDEEVLSFYEELKEYYGDALVNFEHYPKQFMSQVRLYKYYKSKKEEKDESSSNE